MDENDKRLERRIKQAMANLNAYCTIRDPGFRLQQEEVTAKPCVRLSPWHPGRCVLYRSLDGYDHMAANRFTHSVAELDRAAHIANRAIGRAMRC